MIKQGQKAEQPELISLATAARRLGVSLTWMAINSPVEVLWLGRRRFVRLRDFESYLDGLRLRRARENEIGRLGG